MTIATETPQGSEVETKRTGIESPPQERPIEQRIAAKAYALYEERGRRDGYAMQDWLDAEYIVNEEIYETH
jgi:hypothetical protein